MAFENIQKREPRELLTQVDPKRRKVEFANGMTLQMASSQSPKELQGNGEFSSAIYVRFATFALDELDKVCLFFFCLLFSSYCYRRFGTNTSFVICFACLLAFFFLYFFYLFRMMLN